MTSQVNRLAEQIVELQDRIRSLEQNGTGLGHSSFERGAITQTVPGSAGQVPAAQFGQQFDGTFGAVTLNGPPPPTPKGITVEQVGGGVLLTWAGEWEPTVTDPSLAPTPGFAPSDFQNVEAHASTSSGLSAILFDTLKGGFGTARGGTIRIDLPQDTDFYFRLICRTKAGKVGAPSAVVGPYRAGKLGVADVGFDLDLIGGNMIHRQDSQPIGEHRIGDLWLQTPQNIPYRWYGDADGGWVESRDTGVAQAINDAFEAQETADAANAAALGASGAAQAAANVAAGKTTTFQQASPPATTGRTVGDEWIETDQGNLRHVWSGSAWVSAPIGNGAIAPNSLVARDVIATGTVSAALLESIMVLATVIIAGNASGAHVRLDGQGMRVMQPDGNGDGIPDEAIRLGTQTGDRIGILNNNVLVTSLDNTGAITARTLSTREWPVFTAPDYTGQGGSLLAVLDRRPRGIVGWGARYTDAPDAVNLQGVGVFEFGVRLYEGRLYKITSSTIRVESSHDGNLAEVQLRWTLGGLNGSSAPASPTINSEVVTRAQTVVNVASQAPGTAKIQGVQLSKIIGFSGTTGWRDARLLLTHSMFGLGNTVLKAGSGDVLEIWVEDIGPYTGNLQQENTGGGTSSGGTPPPPAAPPPQRYNKSYAATWSAGFKQNGAPRSDTLSIYQGYGDAFNGNQWSMIGFPDMTGDLAGATIVGVGLFLFSEHWWNGNGGTAAIGRHSYLNYPGTLGPDRVDGMAMEPFARNQGRWIDLAAHSPQGWAQGTIRGIVLGFAGAGTNPQYYGRFTPAFGGANAPVINITYVK